MTAFRRVIRARTTMDDGAADVIVVVLVPDLMKERQGAEGPERRAEPDQGQRSHPPPHVNGTWLPRLRISIQRALVAGNRPWSRRSVIDPLSTFLEWFRLAGAAGCPKPEAMVLATATPDGRPSLRTVLYRPAGDGGIRFFTSYGSQKATELDANPRAAVLFYWDAIGRQVRAEGVVTRTSAEESDAYFATRPRLSQLGAIVSPQSRTITDLAELEAEVARLDRVYADRPIPRPPTWGGFRMDVDRWELWTNREYRLHERIELTRQGTTWIRRMLGP